MHLRLDVCERFANQVLGADDILLRKPMAWIENIEICRGYDRAPIENLFVERKARETNVRSPFEHMTNDFRIAS